MNNTTMTQEEVLNLLAGQPGDKLFLLFVGVPGSGKSQLAKELDKRGVRRFSTDQLRKRNPALALQPVLLLKHFYDLLKQRLSKGKRLSDDNPNLTVQCRQKALKMAAAAGYDVAIVYMNTPLEVCLQRNKGRSRVAPDDVVVDMWKTFVANGIPRSSEGRIIRISPNSGNDQLFDVEA